MKNKEEVTAEDGENSGNRGLVGIAGLVNEVISRLEATTCCICLEDLKEGEKQCHFVCLRRQEEQIEEEARRQPVPVAADATPDDPMRAEERKLLRGEHGALRQRNENFNFRVKALLLREEDLKERMYMLQRSEPLKRLLIKAWRGSLKEYQTYVTRRQKELNKTTPQPTPQPTSRPTPASQFCSKILTTLYESILEQILAISVKCSQRDTIINALNVAAFNPETALAIISGIHPPVAIAGVPPVAAVLAKHIPERNWTKEWSDLKEKMSAASALDMLLSSQDLVAFNKKNKRLSEKKSLVSFKTLRDSVGQGWQNVLKLEADIKVEEDDMNRMEVLISSIGVYAADPRESAIQQLLGLALRSLDRKIVVCALETACFNLPTTLKFLLWGIPVAGVSASMEAPVNAPQPGTLDFLRNSKQYKKFLAMVQENPQGLKGCLRRLEQMENPHKKLLMKQRLCDFLYLVNEASEAKLSAQAHEAKLSAQAREAKLSAEGLEAKLSAEGLEAKLSAEDLEAKLSAEGLEAKLSAEGLEAKLSAEDREAIARLGAKGYDIRKAMEAYIFCQGNEEEAAEFLSSHAGKE